MDSNLRNMMRVGIVQFMAYPACMGGNGPILESIDDLAADAFYDVVEVTHIEDASLRKEAAHRIHTGGMELAFGSQPQILGRQLNLHSRDTDLRKKSLALP